METPSFAVFPYSRRVDAQLESTPSGCHALERCHAILDARVVRFDLPGEAFAELALDLTKIRQLPRPDDLRILGPEQRQVPAAVVVIDQDRKSTRMNSSHP